MFKKILLLTGPLCLSTIICLSLTHASSNIDQHHGNSSITFNTNISNVFALISDNKARCQDYRNMVLCMHRGCDWNQHTHRCTNLVTCNQRRSKTHCETEYRCVWNPSTHTCRDKYQ